MVNDTPNIIRVFCIGRNYIEHAHELSSPIPQTPVVFIKPASCLVGPGGAIHYPKHGKDLQHEVELVVQIGKTGRVRTEEDALPYINAITLGLDLTLRDIQKNLKQKGLPWEIAKSFEQSAPIGDFVPYVGSLDLNNISFRCKVNGVEKQKGNTKDMIFSISTLLVELSRIWVLNPGDLIYTGTPAGVGPLRIGDSITVASEQIGSFSWTIIE